MKLRDLGLPRYFQLPRSLFAQAYLNMLAFCGFLGALAQARTWDIRMLFEYAFGVFLIPDAARLSREAERRGSSGFKARPSIRALLLGMAILFGSAPNLADAQSFSDCPPIIYAPPVRCIACHNPHIMGGGSISDLPLHFQQSIYLATGTDNVLDADFAIHGMRDLAATSRNAAATGALIVGTPFAPELTIPMIIAIRSGHAGLEYAVTGSEAEAIRCLPFGGIIDAQAQLDTIGSQDASLLDQVSAGVGLIGTATDLWGAGQGIRRCGAALSSRPTRIRYGAVGDLNSLRQGRIGRRLDAQASSDVTGPANPPVVTEALIREVMEGAPYVSQQRYGISLPKVQSFVDKLLAGETPPNIKVHNGIIIEGNHRYVAGRICGKEPSVDPYIGGRPASVIPWSEIPISPEVWDWE